MNPPAGHSSPKVEQIDTVRIITFTGDKVRDLENMLASELEGRTNGLGACHLLLDFTNVEYLNSLELGTLIHLHKRLKAGGGRLTLFNLSPQIYEVFTITQLQNVLAICREKMPLPGEGCMPLPEREMDRRKETASEDSSDPDKYVYSE